MDDQQNNSPLNTTQSTSIDKRHKLMQYKRQKNDTYTNRYIPKIHIIKPEIISFKTIPQNSVAHNPAVFKPQSTNEQCFNVIAMPMVHNVLKLFNAILIAYGQTCSGKTYSMLPRTLAFLMQQKCIQKLELSAVEAFGHHVAKIYLFDLYNSENQVREWDKKKGVTTIESERAIKQSISDAQNAHSNEYFQEQIHFEPKLPELIEMKMKKNQRNGKII